METGKCLGIWMDHSNAHLIELTSEGINERIITSKFTHQAKEESLHKSEQLMHNKEQHEQGEYFRKLGEIIRNYKEVLLFGPTNAKAELFNILRANHLFANIKIEMLQADKMTTNQEHVFVKDYFAKQ